MENKTNILIPKYNLNFKINKNKNIIQAALEMGIKLAFSCRSGVCGTCKAKILNGTVNNSKGVTHNLTPEERKNNIVYTCQSLATSDNLELDFLSPLSNQLHVKNNIPKEFVLEVLSKTIIGKTCIELTTTFPKNIITFTHDGLKVKIIIDGKISKKEYSILSPKLKEDGNNNGILTIYIPITENIHKTISPGQTITISGPYLINDDLTNLNKPFLFLGSKSNIIPVLSYIKETLFNKNDQIIMLVANFDCADNIQFMNEMHKIQNKYENFNYKIILTKEIANNNTRFIYGSPESALGKILSNLSNHIIYISKDIDNYSKLILKINNLGALKKNIKIIN